MNSAAWWLQWLAAFMAVLAVLTIGVAIQEYLDWRKGNRKP